MNAPSPNDAPVGNSPSTAPLYSPITVSSIHAAVAQFGFPPEYIPIVADVLDEFQLALSAAHDGRLLTEDLPRRTKDSRYLHLDRYTGCEPTGTNADGTPRSDDVLFVSGDLVRSLFDDYLCKVVAIKNADDASAGDRAAPNHPLSTVR